MNPRKVLAMVAAVLAVAGCSGGGSTPDRHGDVDFLSGCGPIKDPLMAKIAHAVVLHQQSESAICGWSGPMVAADGRDAGPVDLTYGWLENDTLLNEAAVAQRLGYTLDHFVVKHFGGYYLRDPRDPGSCGATAYDTGTVTWWVQNRTHLPSPDPCAAALDLLANTLGIDGV